MKVVIIDYKAGNTQSVAFALERLGIQPVLSNNPEVIVGADKIIFPGVGEASTTMKYLRKQNLDRLIPALKQPVLGICLGMQLMCSYSEEGNVDCLGIFPLKVEKFKSNTLKVPHIGWNTIKNNNSWLSKISEESYVYYVHSYFVPLSEYTVAATAHGYCFSAALNHANFYAVQFHPEKSGTTGSLILKSFIDL